MNCRQGGQADDQQRLPCRCGAPPFVPRSPAPATSPRGARTSPCARICWPTELRRTPALQHTAKCSSRRRGSAHRFSSELGTLRNLQDAQLADANKYQTLHLLPSGASVSRLTHGYRDAKRLRKCFAKHFLSAAQSGLVEQLHPWAATTLCNYVWTKSDTACASYRVRE